MRYQPPTTIADAYVLAYRVEALLKTCEGAYAEQMMTPRLDTAEARDRLHALLALSAQLLGQLRAGLDGLNTHVVPQLGEPSPRALRQAVVPADAAGASRRVA